MIKPYSLHFYNHQNEQLQQDIWHELSQDLWRSLSVDNQLFNNTVPASQPHKYKPVFDNFTTIYPGARWNKTSNQLEEDLYLPDFTDVTKNRFYQICESYFQQFSDKKIAVHLSGGIDSSIIIGLLNHIGIPFYLVGLANNRFEFRTEKAVQEKLAPLGIDALLLDMDNYPSFSSLSNKPPHQLPDGNIKLVEASRAIAKACKSLGAELVFTGQGGDTIFADAIPEQAYNWSCNIGNEFILDYESEVLYPEQNIELVSPYADKKLIQAIYSLRLGQPHDHLKKWARQFFSDILPRELVHYTYSADFFGTSMDGLAKAKPEIEQLFKTTYKITGHPVFSPKGTAKMLATDVFSFEYATYTDFCNRISIAVWYNSLLKANFI